VETADGLVPALQTAFKAGGIYLVTVPVDYSENRRVLVTELRNRVPAPRVDLREDKTYAICEKKGTLRGGCAER
jgi:hypothetical protein